MADGSLGGFSKLADHFRTLSEVPSQVSREAAEDIQASIEMQFDQGCDPYGNPWKELAPSTIARGRFPPPGTDTHALRESIIVKPMSGSGIQVDVGEDYGIYYHRVRPILPEGEMPLMWEEAIRKSTEAAIKRRLK